MALMDSRGRLFGRLNVVDALLLLFVAALVPLAYGAYVLFKAPPPQLTGIEPATLVHAPNMRITVRGEDLRPYMRIAIGDLQARNFLFYNANTAEVDLPELPPGVYDVTLYDYAQERARLTDALTITPSPLPATQVDVVGAFRSVNAEVAKQISSGMAVGELGKVLQTGAPRPSVVRAIGGESIVEILVDAVDVPAVLRIGCQLQGAVGRVQCVADGVTLATDAFLNLPTPAGKQPFQVDQVRAAVDLVPVEVRVRLRGDAQTLALIAPGDVDAGVVRNPLAAGATVLAAGGVSADAREVTVQVMAQRGASAWRFAGADLRAGSAFRLVTRNYEVAGTVLRVTPELPSAQADPQ